MTKSSWTVLRAHAYSASPIVAGGERGQFRRRFDYAAAAAAAADASNRCCYDPRRHRRPTEIAVRRRASRRRLFFASRAGGDDADCGAAADDEQAKEDGDDPLLRGVPCARGSAAVSRHSAAADDDKKKKKKKESYRISYTVVRPMNLSSRKAAPVVTLHGGPSLPSDYLLPLAKVLPYRSVVFWDQLGCGESDQPVDKSCYSIGQTVDDLEALLRKLSLRRFHLYGHSFGGTLAYEYVKRVAERGKDNDGNKDDDDDDEGCLSVVLSSTGTSMPVLERQYDRFLSQLGGDEEKFRTTHQCRTPGMPEPLARSYRKTGTAWVGFGAIRGYESTPPHDGAVKMPSALILRGEYDFATEDCVRGWKDLFNHPFVRFRTLEGCSHHALLENGELYGEVLDSFFSEYD